MEEIFENENERMISATIVDTVSAETKETGFPEGLVKDIVALRNYLGVTKGQRLFEGVTHTDLEATGLLPELPAGKLAGGYVFFVTPEQNKFKDGAYSLEDRKRLMGIIKRNSLEEKVKARFGRCYSQVKTAGLDEFVQDWNIARSGRGRGSGFDSDSYIISKEQYGEYMSLKKEAEARNSFAEELGEAAEGAVSASIPQAVHSDIHTEKRLWVAVSAVLEELGANAADVDAINDGIDEVFPSSYSAQDLANMRR